MPTYVKPVSKLHWMLAFEADRCEVLHPSIGEEWYKIPSNQFTELTPLSWWDCYTNKPDTYKIRIRIEDTSSDG